MRIPRLSILILLFFAVSCANLPNQAGLVKPEFKARLLLYIHSESAYPPDIRFTVDSMALQNSGGKWTEVAIPPVDISSTELSGNQKFLAELPVEPGRYKAVRLRIAKATRRGFDLALPPGGKLLFPMDIELNMGDSSVISMVWDAGKTVGKGILFQPSIVVEQEPLSSRGLLIYVTNSGSNHITIIDRSLERVVGAITVGDGPKGMVLGPTGERVYILNTISSTVSIIDTSNHFVFDEIGIISGNEPVELAVYSDPDNISPGEGKIYIINRGSNDVSVVDISRRRLIQTIPVGLKPSAIAVDVNRREVYVTNEISNTLSIIDVTTNTVKNTIVVEDRPSGLVINEDSIYVFNEGSNRISVVSQILRKVVRTINVGSGPKRGILAFSERLFVTGASGNVLTFIDPSGAITRTISVKGFPLNLMADEERYRIYVTAYNSSMVYLIDPNTEKVLKGLHVGKNPYGIVMLEQ